MRASLLWCALFAMFVVSAVCFDSTRASADSEKENPYEKVSWSLSTGYFLPNEGDVDGGIAFGGGMKYRLDKGAAFIDVIYSPTDTNVSVTGSNGDVKNTLVDVGYMSEINNVENVRAGGGIQFHRMSISGAGGKTVATATGLVEYDFSKNLTGRLQTTAATKKNSIRYGGEILALVIYNF